MSNSCNLELTEDNINLLLQYMQAKMLDKKKGAGIKLTLNFDEQVSGTKLEGRDFGTGQSSADYVEAVELQ